LNCETITNSVAFLIQLTQYFSGSLPSQAKGIEEVELPLSVTDRPYIMEMNLETFNRYDYGAARRGQWMLTVDDKDLNRAWLRATELYRKGELIGIASIFINTNYADTRYTRKALVLRCSPCDKEDVVKCYGRNLLKYLREFCSENLIKYKDYEEHHSTNDVQPTPNIRYRYELRFDELEDQGN